jgi:hypothetical protein
VDEKRFDERQGADGWLVGGWQVRRSASSSSLDDTHRRPNPSSRQLGNDLNHLININKLHPTLQLPSRLMPNKLDLVRIPKERAYAFVLFVYELGAAGDTKVGGEDAEFPAGEGFAVAGGGLVGDVEFEAGVVEADGLPEGADVGVFEGEEDAEAAEHDLFGLVFEGFEFECCKLFVGGWVSERWVDGEGMARTL